MASTDPAAMVNLCQRMRLIQQMDAGALSTDAAFHARILTELALGDAKRGIPPWVSQLASLSYEGRSPGIFAHSNCGCSHWA